MAKVTAVTIGRIELTPARHKRILGWVNRNRQSRGLSALPKLVNSSDVGSSNHCPMAKSLNRGAKQDNRIEVAYGNGDHSGIYPKDEYLGFTPFPKYVHEFHEQMMAARPGF